MRLTLMGRVVDKTKPSRNEEWLDVCLKNVVIFLSFLEGNGFDPEPLWTAIRLVVNESAEWLGSRYEHLSSIPFPNWCFRT